MKKIGTLVLVGTMFLPALGFAQHKESKKEKIARLEREVVLFQTANKQEKQRADSIAAMGAQTAVQLDMVNHQYKSLEAQNKELAAKIDSLATVNKNLEAEVAKAKVAETRAKAAEQKAKAAEQKAKAKEAEIKRLNKEVKELEDLVKNRDHYIDAMESGRGSWD